MGRDAYQPLLSRDEQERRRLLAAGDLRAGLTQAKVAKKYSVSRASVSRWNSSLKKGGLKALRRTNPPGKRPALDLDQARKLERILLRGAQAYGYEADVWTLPRLAEVIKKEFGVRLDQSNVGKLLVRRGFSWQRPTRRANERDEPAIRRWVRDEWPKIAKKGRG